MGRKSKIIPLPVNKMFTYDMSKDIVNQVLSQVKIDWTDKEKELIESIKKDKEGKNAGKRKGRSINFNN